MLFRKKKPEYVTKDMLHKYIEDSIKTTIEAEKENLLSEPTSEIVDYFYKLKIAIEKKETDESSNTRQMKFIVYFFLGVVALLFLALGILASIEICKGKLDYILVFLFCVLCLFSIYVVSFYVKNATKNGVYNIIMTFLAVGSLFLTVIMGN